MTKTDPRRFLQFLLGEWDLIESIHEATRRQPLRLHALRRMIGAESSPRTLDRLIEYGVIVALPNSPAYEMGDLVQNLVEQLRREHALGLVNELKVYLGDLSLQSSGIAAALQEPDHEKLARHVAALQHRLKALRRQLLNNGEALMAMVVRAKTRQRTVPLRQRYAEVLEAWDTYVEPVRAMVDPAGPFEGLFERLEQELNQALAALAAHGGLAGETSQLELLLLRLIHLRGELRAHLSATTELLMPMVREARRNSVVARGASMMVSGLRRGRIESALLAGLLPISRRAVPGIVAGREAIESYVANLGNYRPEAQEFAGATARPVAAGPPPLDLDGVADAIRQESGIADLLDWLIERYGNVAETEDLLELYFRMAGRPEGLRIRQGEKRRYEARTHFIVANGLAIARGENEL